MNPSKVALISIAIACAIAAIYEIMILGWEASYWLIMIVLIIFFIYTIKNK